MRPARKLFSMHIASAPRTQDLLELAQQCISLALQLDYLSNGAGHRQSGKPHAADTKLAVGLASGARSRDIVRQYLAEVATRKRLSSSEGVLEALPDEQRDAVRAHVIHERSYSEIASELQCSEALVRQRVSRGLRALRIRLAGER